MQFLEKDSTLTEPVSALPCPALPCSCRPLSVLRCLLSTQLSSSFPLSSGPNEHTEFTQALQVSRGSPLSD